MNVAFEKQQASVDEFKKAVLESMQKIHEALTPEQRRVAGELLQYGPRALHGGGCGGGGGFGRGRWAHHGRAYGPSTGDSVSL